MRLTATIGAALALTVLSIASAAAAEFVIIGSTSAAYTAGRIIDAAIPLSIADGERITVVAADGKTRMIEGPFEGAVDSGTDGTVGKTLIQSLSELVLANQRRTSIAGVRVGAAAAAPDDIFVVRVDFSGRVCLAGSEARLWRPNAADRGTLLIREIGGENREAELDWPAGSRRLAWPQEIPPQDAMSYLLRFRDGNRRATRIDIAFVERAAPTTAHRIAILGEKQCLQQAMQLLGELVDDER